jgi:SAM-dependent methyltransferase
MDPLDRQARYWDDAAEGKRFTHPLDRALLAGCVAPEARILDLGCGYGRIVSDLAEAGYRNVVGIDISGRMIERGRRLHPGADLRVFEGPGIPFPPGAFDMVLLFAVLTCVPTDGGQRALVSGIERVLRPGGFLYVSDYLLQEDERNRERYGRFEARYGTRGVFELPEGAVVRHHSPEWVRELFSRFAGVRFRTLDAATMNGNPAKIFQYLGRKR